MSLKKTCTPMKKITPIMMIIWSGKRIGFVFQKREKNLRFFDVTYSPPIPV